MPGKPHQTQPCDKAYYRLWPVLVGSVPFGDEDGVMSPPIVDPHRLGQSSTEFDPSVIVYPQRGLILEPGSHAPLLVCHVGIGDG